MSMTEEVSVAGADTLEEVARRTDLRIAKMTRVMMSLTGITGVELARRLGISRVAVSDRLRGVTHFLASDVAVLAEIFGCPVSRLYEDPAEIFPELVRTGNRCFVSSAAQTLFDLDGAFGAPADGWAVPVRNLGAA